MLTKTHICVILNITQFCVIAPMPLPRFIPLGFGYILQKGGYSVKVIGMRRVDYARKSDNKHVQGWNIYATYSDDKVEGLACREFYVNDSVFDKAGCYVPQIGDEINVYYNQFKGIEMIFKVEG